MVFGMSPPTLGGKAVPSPRVGIVEISSPPNEANNEVPPWQMCKVDTNIASIVGLSFGKKTGS